MIERWCYAGDIMQEAFVKAWRIAFRTAAGLAFLQGMVYNDERIQNHKEGIWR